MAQSREDEVLIEKTRL